MCCDHYLTYVCFGRNIISKCNNAGADNRKQCNRKLYDVGGVMVTGVLLIVVGTAGIIAATVCKGQYNVEQLELLWGYSSILVVC